MAGPLDETKKSLTRIQEIDPQEIARAKELGASVSLAVLVPPAEQLVKLFQQLPAAALDDFPDGNLQQIQQQADATFAIFQTVRNYNVETGNLQQFRQQTLAQLTQQYPGSFATLFPYISYAAAKTTDFQNLERQGRAAVQSIQDRTAELLDQIKTTKEQADEAVRAAQRAASEQGVSQQATYFRDEAKTHEETAAKWQKWTTGLAIGLGVYSVATVFLHKWDYLHPKDAFDAAQLITTKVLVFAVLSYMLVLASKNFLSHKHNAIVNRHRQNALMTFNALAAATKDEAAKDIILTHAAGCIFSPQETGYAKGSAPESSLGQAMAGLLAKSESRAN